MYTLNYNRGQSWGVKAERRSITALHLCQTTSSLVSWPITTIQYSEYCSTQKYSEPADSSVSLSSICSVIWKHSGSMITITVITVLRSLIQKAELPRSVANMSCVCVRVCVCVCVCVCVIGGEQGQTCSLPGWKRLMRNHYELSAVHM